MNSSFANSIRDVISVLKGAWFLLLFDLLASLAFLIAPQGRDTLLVVMENTGSFEHLWQITALSGAILFWCITSEFSMRMLIYLTDNSGRSLSPERVIRRKRYQRYAGRAALFYPVILVTAAFILIYVTNSATVNESDTVYDTTTITKGFACILVLLCIESALIWFLYPGKFINTLSKKSPRFRWMAISPREKDWLDKLFGMLNNVRIDIPASNTQFAGTNLPRGVVLPDGSIIPNSTFFEPYTTNPQLAGSQNQSNVWMFRVKIGFYSCLLRQLIILIALAVLVIFLVGFVFPIQWLIGIGSVSIICFGFACWQMVYVGLHFLDKAQAIPVRFILIVWLIVCSAINRDHPARITTSQEKKKERPHLEEHFSGWLAQLSRDSLNNPYYRINTDTIPVIFVSAEGGALRTGAFTGMALAALQDKDPLFAKYLYAFSSVSGGTLGSNFFNAQFIYDRTENGLAQKKWSEGCLKYFKTDFLSPVTAKLVFSEVVNYLIPYPIQRADRAIALEKAFEHGWSEVYSGNAMNILSADFDQTISNELPAILINTTEVESGLQCIWSNVKLDSIPFKEQRDLHDSLLYFSKMPNATIAYSTAINLSDRFPLISPAACFFAEQGKRRHFIDGGYYENKGSETLLQVLKSLHLENRKVKPYILQFNFGEENDVKSVSTFNEVSEIIGGVYNTRSGRGKIAEDALRAYVKSLHGEFIPLALDYNAAQLPMNWVLSERALQRINGTVKTMVDLRHNDSLTFVPDSNRNQLRKLFIYKKRYKRFPTRS